MLLLCCNKLRHYLNAHRGRSCRRPSVRRGFSPSPAHLRRTEHLYRKGSSTLHSLMQQWLSAAMIRKSLRLKTLGSGTLLALCVHAALAGDENLGDLDLSTLMKMDVTLVTAQKRTENLDTVPISMTVLKASAIHGLK